MEPLVSPRYRHHSLLSSGGNVIAATEGWRFGDLYGPLALAYAAILTAIAGCTGPSAVQHVDDLARQAGLKRQIVRGTAFRHVLYLPAEQRTGRFLHVYIEGDGRPWLDRYTVATEPTPRNPLLLRMLKQDTAPIIYLGRPCYFGLATDAECRPEQWTSKRFSSEVIASMRAVLLQVPRNGKGVVLIGHSGGGTLAMLLAGRVPMTVGVVTVAGNLDTDAWTRHHGYTPLYGSLNPATDTPLAASILQWHYVGLRDTRVPPMLTRIYAASHANARVMEVADYDHTCCWDRDWRSRLQSLHTALTTSP